MGSWYATKGHLIHHPSSQGWASNVLLLRICVVCFVCWRGAKNILPRILYTTPVFYAVHVNKILTSSVLDPSTSAMVRFPLSGVLVGKREGLGILDVPSGFVYGYTKRIHP